MQLHPTTATSSCPGRAIRGTSARFRRSCGCWPDAAAAARRSCSRCCRRPARPTPEERPAAPGAAHDRGEAQAAAAAAADAEGGGEAEARAEGRAGDPPPVDQQPEGAREGAETGCNQFKDELADLRQNIDTDAAGRPRTFRRGRRGCHAERSLITSKVGGGSGGITSANAAAASAPARARSPAMTPRASIRASRTPALNSAPRRTAAAAAASPRSRGGDRAGVRPQQGRDLRAVRARACANNADLQGKLVLEFTIAPSGEVTECRVVSSELNDPDLEQQDRGAREAVPLRGQGCRCHHHHQADRVLPRIVLR